MEKKEELNELLKKKNDIISIKRLNDLIKFGELIPRDVYNRKLEELIDGFIEKLGNINQVFGIKTMKDLIRRIEIEYEELKDKIER